MKKFYINVQGGCGLNLALASFITAANTKYPNEYEFNVCSPYFDIFESCEAVTNVYKPQELKDMIFDAKANDGIIINQRLYDMNDFIYKRITYSEAWAELMGIKWDEDNSDGSAVKSVLKPETKYPFLTQQVDNIKKQLNGKKFIIVQWQGGQSPLTQVPADQNGQADWGKVSYPYDNEPLKRHYPIEKAKEFCNLFKLSHPDVEIIEYSLPNEPHCDNTIRAVMPYLAYYMLAKDRNCIGTVSIDSSLQHLIAGVTKSVVIWGHSINADNSDKIIANPFGYKYNKNIVQHCRRDDILFFSALGPSGAKISYIQPSDLLIEVDNYLFKSGTSIDKNKETK